jgi:hypothetical protein
MPNRKASLLPLSLLALAACGVDDSAPPTTNELHGQAQLFAPDAHPFGIAMDRWAERMWKWIYRQPPETNPLLDLTGADCGVDQAGPVWFLPSLPGGPMVVEERHCTIPRHKALLVQTATYLNDFPCPDPAFRPAPGQTLFDFLLADAAAFIDTVTLLDVTIDGVPQRDMLDYRFVSNNVFQIHGDAGLQAVFDPCITGRPQAAITDGYLFMVKPLAPGEHTLTWHVIDTFGNTGNTTLTYHLTVQ